MKRGALGLPVLVLAGCAVPNLDEAVAGEPASSIRERIAAHGAWDETLSDEQLDQLAEFIAEYAGATEGGQAVEGPALEVWRTNDCGTCHVLVAAGPGDE